MYQRKSNLSNLAVMLLDCAVIFLSLTFANYIRHHQWFVADNGNTDFKVLVVIFLLSFLGLNLFLNLYRNMVLRGPFQELLEIIRNNLTTLAIAMFILYFSKLLDYYSRLVMGYFCVISIVLMFAVHQLWKKCLPYLYQHLGNQRKLLLAASPGNAEDLVSDMLAMKDYSYEITGLAILTDEKAIPKSVQGIPVVASAPDLIEYCQGASLDEVLICGKNGEEESLRPIMEKLSAMGITVHCKINLLELKGAHTRVLSQFGRFHTITYANRLAPLGQLLLKRALDLCGALVGLLVLAVLTVILTPLIKLESPGSVFFAQKRVGRNGRIFKMYKFRSMYADAEQRKAELMAQNEMQGLMFKMENDPRITKIGAFLRKTSLDEFPQFINILKGDMSLVGTRPPTLDEFAQYNPYHKKRLSFRPGLTGMWQVSGRSDITDFEEIVRLDVEYIDHWSFLLDIKILFKTFFTVGKGSGAK